MGYILEFVSKLEIVNMVYGKIKTSLLVAQNGTSLNHFQLENQHHFNFAGIKRTYQYNTKNVRPKHKKENA